PRRRRRRRRARWRTQRLGRFSSTFLSSYWGRRFLRGSAPPGLRARLLGFDRADDLAGGDRLAPVDGGAPRGSGAVGAPLVLPLHRLDDADHLTGLDLVALGDRHGENRALHRRDDGVASGRAAAALPHALPAAARECAPLRLGLRQADLEPPSVHFDRANVL